MMRIHEMLHMPVEYEVLCKGLTYFNFCIVWGSNRPIKQDGCVLGLVWPGHGPAHDLSRF